jgi:transcriptional regulator with XRE-family HTH domain
LSHFGDLVRKLRMEKGLTLEAVAKKIGSHKGYVSGIENDKVNPPSVAIIKKYAKLFRQDARTLARLAWVDKAPEILREDAEKFLEWCQRAERSPGEKATSPVEPSPVSPVPDSALKV